MDCYQHVVFIVYIVSLWLALSLLFASHSLFLAICLASAGTLMLPHMQGGFFTPVCYDGTLFGFITQSESSKIES